jgi:GNAT superfamily N-acetyltransferase
MIKTTYTLEMASPTDFKRSNRDTSGFSVSRVVQPYPELAKFMHTMVGHPWSWGGRETWGESEWTDLVSQSGYEMGLASINGAPAGYFELLAGEGNVQVRSMGLIPNYIGQGYGGALLNATTDRAWEMGAGRVWLRTCSQDHPHAKDNYISRGFTVTRTTEGPTNDPILSFWDLNA